MTSKFSKFERINRKYISKTRPLYQTKEGKELLDNLSNGQNHYLRLNRIESSAMDMTWIKEVEDTIPALGEIISNPKKTIHTVSEVVQIEKAKKVSRESVQHLSAHTEFIKSIDEEGNVTPNKILNVYNDDYYAIYENKFIATLVRRLIIFVEKRYNYVLHQAKLKDVELLYFKNKSVIDGCDVEIETKIRYSKPAPDSEQEKLKGYLKRIEDVRKYLKFYTTSEFMHILRRERDVKNPILQTNIIRKNPKYRKCYHLWQFINKYQESGLEVKVEEKYADLSTKEIENINKTMFVNFVTLKGKDPKVFSSKKMRKYKPRILNTYDDEIYRPDPYYQGPIEFIRIDDKYREYEESLLPLNPHPTKGFRQYNEEEYADNRNKKEKTKQVDSLINRKKRELEKYNKEQESLLQKEKEDEEVISILAEQEVIKDQEELLNSYREELKYNAVVEHSLHNDDSLIKEEEVPEIKEQETPEIKEEENVVSKIEAQVEVLENNVEHSPDVTQNDNLDNQEIIEDIEKPKEEKKTATSKKKNNSKKKTSTKKIANTVKKKESLKEETIIKPVPEPKKEKSLSKKEKIAERKARQEAKEQAKILKTKVGRKNFKRR